MAEYFTKDGESYVPVKDSLHTQDDLDRVINDRLDRERKKFGDYDALKEQVGTLKTELDTKTKTLLGEKTDLEGKLKMATLETEKVKIVNEFKLSEDLAEFVGGDTTEEMRTKAEKLSKGIKPGQVKIDKEEKPDKKTSDSKEIAGKLFRRKSDD